MDGPRVRVVVYQEGYQLVAEGVEIDTRVFANEIDTLRDRFCYHGELNRHKIRTQEAADRLASMWSDARLVHSYTLYLIGPG